MTQPKPPSRTPTTTAPPVEDFNANELLTVSQEHTRSIEQLRKDVDSLLTRLGDNDCFGGTFEQVAKNDKRVDAIIAATLVILIAHDTNIRDAIEAVVANVDRQRTRVLTNRFAGVAMAVILIVLTALVTTAINNHIAIH